jgi:hypothetical protein
MTLFEFLNGITQSLAWPDLPLHGFSSKGCARPLIFSLLRDY